MLIATGVLSLAVALELVASTPAAGAVAAKAAPSPRCGVTVRMLRGRFSGSVMRTVGTSCAFARGIVEVSLRAMIRAGGDGSGEFSTLVSPRPTRGYPLRCVARGNLYSQRGI